jgi:hypothetical protein
MQLSDELFADIRKAMGLGDDGDTTAAGAPASNASGAPACRRSGRMDASQARVEIQPFGALQGRRAIALQDVSKRGVSFVDDRAWGAGEKFVIFLRRSATHVIPFLCVVRNSRVADDRFRIGAEFVDEREAPARMVIRSPHAQADAVAAEAAVATAEASAGRRAPRKRFPKAGAWAQLHTYENGAAGPILEADVVDLSEGGVGFICDAALDPGQKLIVRCCPAGGSATTRMCEVVTCRPQDGGGFRVGTRFIAYTGRRLSQVLFGWLRTKG